MWNLVLFFFIVEVSSLCSSLFFCLIFLILKKLHHDETPWKAFLTTYGKWRRLGWLCVVELISLCLITPISFWWCHRLQMEPISMWAMAVPLLSLASTCFKYIQVIQLIKKAEFEGKDDAIYQ